MPALLFVVERHAVAGTLIASKRIAFISSVRNPGPVFPPVIIGWGADLAVSFQEC
jgi:hypothetical protein